MKKLRQLMLTAVIIGSVLTTATAAESFSVLLQKGIFAEETEGNLDAAIKIYQQITAEAATNLSVVAQAQYRLGVCYQKKGNKEQAISTLNDLLKQFPAEAALGQKARELLAGLGQTPSSNIVMRRVLADASGVDGVLTADGKYIRDIDRDTGDVVQFEVASGQTSRITNREPWSETEQWGYYFQAFSRDGKQIAYGVYLKEGGVSLRIRNLDGSGLRTLFSDKGVENVMPVDWSPDAGSILAFRDRNTAIELTLISAADGSVRVLRSISGGWFKSQTASLSPDGRFVAFSYVREGSPPHSDVFLMTADGRDEVAIASHPAEDQLLGWSPNGKNLVFLSDRSGTWDIWTVHITGGKQQGEPELLKKDFGFGAEVLGFAPDGSCYYKTDTSSGRLYNGEVDLETGKVLVAPAPVTTRYTGPPSQPTWSPDGRNLAYISRRGSIAPGNNILTIRSTATEEERFLSPPLRYVNQISWAPDGRSVIAVGITGTGLGIFRIDTETSGITKLADGGVAPKLCPDGKTLVFVKGGPILMKRNLDTGEESEVVKAGRMFYDLSPDGREVVFQVDGAVKTVSLNGGEPRELFRGSAQYYRLRWTRDGRYIIAQAGDTASSEIWRVPAQGGNGVVISITVTNAGFGYTNGPLVVIDPPFILNPVLGTPPSGTVIPPRTATGTAIMTGNFVTGVNITDGGSGYTNTPLVRFIGGGGSGAGAYAVVSKPLKLDLSVPKMEFFTLHPDNRRFAFSVDEGDKSELWVMENFLPKEKLAEK